MESAESLHHETQAEAYLTKAHTNHDDAGAQLFATIAGVHASLAVLHQLRAETR